MTTRIPPPSGTQPCSHAKLSRPSSTRQPWLRRSKPLLRRCRPRVRDVRATTSSVPAISAQKSRSPRGPATGSQGRGLHARRSATSEPVCRWRDRPVVVVLRPTCDSVSSSCFRSRTSCSSTAPEKPAGAASGQTHDPLTSGPDPWGRYRSALAGACGRSRVDVGHEGLRPGEALN